MSITDTTARSSYLVYRYRYREMKQPKIDAVRRIHHDRRDLDLMPPTVIAWWNIAATTKREAIQTGRSLIGRP